MNKRMIFHILGMLLILEAALLLLPALVALIYGEQAGWYYLFTAAGAALVGLALRTACRPENDLCPRRSDHRGARLDRAVACGRAAVYALRRHPVVS